MRLEGTASNRDAIGARVAVTAGGRRQTAWRLGGGSYASAEDPRLHFGLGPARTIDEVEVRWPSGRVDRFRDLPADTGYLIREGEPDPLPLPGFSTQDDLNQASQRAGSVRRSSALIVSGMAEASG